MQHALSEYVVGESTIGEDDPIIAPMMREQLDDLIGGPRNAGVGNPERALMRALLQDAILCLIGEAAPAKDRVRLADEARCWVRSRSRAWIFAFANVCEVLGIEPDTAREKLLAIGQKLNGALALGDESGANGENALHSVRGLRRCGQRPRRAIHFMKARRRRRSPETPTEDDL